MTSLAEIRKRFDELQALLDPHYKVVREADANTPVADYERADTRLDELCRGFMPEYAQMVATLLGEVLRLTEALRTLRATLSFASADSWDFGPDTRERFQTAAAEYDVAFGRMTDDEAAVALRGLMERFNRAGFDAVKSAEARATALEAQIPTREQIAQSLASTVTAKRSYRGRPWMELEPVTREAFLLDADAILALWNHQGGAR